MNSKKSKSDKKMCKLKGAGLNKSFRICCRNYKLCSNNYYVQRKSFFMFTWISNVIKLDRQYYIQVMDKEDSFKNKKRKSSPTFVV